MNLTCKTCVHFVRTGHRNFGLCGQNEKPTSIHDSRCKLYEQPKVECCDTAPFYIRYSPYSGGWILKTENSLYLEGVMVKFCPFCGGKL